MKFDKATIVLSLLLSTCDSMPIVLANEPKPAGTPQPSQVMPTQPYYYGGAIFTLGEDRIIRTPSAKLSAQQVKNFLAQNQYIRLNLARRNADADATNEFGVGIICKDITFKIQPISAGDYVRKHKITLAQINNMIHRYLSAQERKTRGFRNSSALSLVTTNCNAPGLKEFVLYTSKAKIERGEYYGGLLLTYEGLIFGTSDLIPPPRMIR